MKRELKRDRLANDAGQAFALVGIIAAVILWIAGTGFWMGFGVLAAGNRPAG